MTLFVSEISNNSIFRSIGTTVWLLGLEIVSFTIDVSKSSLARLMVKTVSVKNVNNIQRNLLLFYIFDKKVIFVTLRIVFSTNKMSAEVFFTCRLRSVFLGHSLYPSKTITAFIRKRIVKCVHTVDKFDGKIYLFATLLYAKENLYLLYTPHIIKYIILKYWWLYEKNYIFYYKVNNICGWTIASVDVRVITRQNKRFNAITSSVFLYKFFSIIKY